MLKDYPGSSNGITSQLYKANEPYTVSDTLGNIFVNQLNVENNVEPPNVQAIEEIPQVKDSNPITVSVIQGMDKDELLVLIASDEDLKDSGINTKLTRPKLAAAIIDKLGL
jgi:hypothetical protein